MTAEARHEDLLWSCATGAAIPALTPVPDHVRTTGALSGADASVGRTDGSIGIPVSLGTPGPGARHGEKSPA
jgi:hypothetical protein